MTRTSQIRNRWRNPPLWKPVTSQDRSVDVLQRAPADRTTRNFYRSRLTPPFQKIRKIGETAAREPIALRGIHNLRGKGLLGLLCDTGIGVERAREIAKGCPILISGQEVDNLPCLPGWGAAFERF